MNLFSFFVATITCKCRFSCIPVGIYTGLAPPGQGMVKDVIVQQACRVDHLANQRHLPLFTLHLKSQFETSRYCLMVLQDGLHESGIHELDAFTSLLVAAPVVFSAALPRQTAITGLTAFPAPSK